MIHTQKFTSVSLYFPDRAAEGSMHFRDKGMSFSGIATGQTMVPGPFVINDEGSIEGCMIVQMAGSDTPQVFPVNFSRQSPANIPGKPPGGLFRASVAFKMGHDGKGGPSGLVMYSTEGLNTLDVSDGTLFTFNGEISIPGAAITNGTLEDSYNNRIVNGETIWHQAEVSGTTLNVDLKWQDSSDDLKLTIYTPDGHVLGPYDDSADGKSDGRINLEISNNGDVADGTWSFKVLGADVAGKDEYYLRTW